METTRYHNHAQVSKTIEFREVWTFNCARCNDDDKNYYLRHARPLADGTLVCRWCFTKEDIHDLQRCAKCGGMFPPAEYHHEPRPDFEAVYAAFGPPQPWTECQACRAPIDRTRDCEMCEESFNPKRNDARYCSTRCRVAAHRRKD